MKALAAGSLFLAFLLQPQGADAQDIVGAMRETMRQQEIEELNREIASLKRDISNIYSILLSVQQTNQMLREDLEKWKRTAAEWRLDLYRLEEKLREK